LRFEPRFRAKIAQATLLIILEHTGTKDTAFKAETHEGKIATRDRFGECQVGRGNYQRDSKVLRGIQRSSVLKSHDWGPKD